MRALPALGQAVEIIAKESVDQRMRIAETQAFVSVQRVVPDQHKAWICFFNLFDFLQLKRFAAREQCKDLKGWGFAAKDRIGGWPERRCDETSAVRGEFVDQFFQHSKAVGACVVNIQDASCDLGLAALG